MYRIEVRLKNPIDKISYLVYHLNVVERQQAIIFVRSTVNGKDTCS